MNGRDILIGAFNTEEEAARAFDAKVQRVYLNPICNFLPDGALNPDRKKANSTRYLKRGASGLDIMCGVGGGSSGGDGEEVEEEEEGAAAATAAAAGAASSCSTSPGSGRGGRGGPGRGKKRGWSSSSSQYRGDETCMNLTC